MYIGAKYHHLEAKQSTACGRIAGMISDQLPHLPAPNSFLLH
jgi:hypothetical protein